MRLRSGEGSEKGFWVGRRHGEGLSGEECLCGVNTEQSGCVGTQPRAPNACQRKLKHRRGSDPVSILFSRLELTPGSSLTGHLCAAKRPGSGDPGKSVGQSCSWSLEGLR